MFNDSLKCCLLFKKAFNLWLFGSGVLFSFCLCCVLFRFFFANLALIGNIYFRPAFLKIGSTISL